MARFTTNDRVLAPLWDRGDMVRLALVANRSRMFVPHNVDLKPLLEGESRELVHAMMTNPTMEAEWLAAILTNTMDLEPEHWWNVCASGIMNPRLKHRLDADAFDDQVLAWEHEKPIGAVWDLFLTTPATPKWASALMGI